ncbi:hypothetical protein [Streptomyces sp. NPDC051994]|uniref:hypothetical protein n=1 Tax=unclassified Streptomyces TaxID=2593676 RepID=UPI0034476D1F
MLHLLEPVFFMLTTISSLVPLAVALRARWSALHLEPDAEDWACAVDPLPLLEPVEPEEPEEEPEAEPWPLVEVPALVELLAPVELLALADALVLAEALDPSLLLHAVSERPAAATTTARADIFLTRIGTPGKQCGIGRSLQLSGHSCFIGVLRRAMSCGRIYTKTPL